MKRNPVNRRQILKGAGVSIALPWLESAQILRGDENTSPHQRMVLSWYALGFHTPNLFPKEGGSDLKTSRYLKHFHGLHDDITVISRLYQDGRRGGHGVKSYAWRGIPEGNYLESFDVFAGRMIGHDNRFANLTLGKAAGGGVQSYAANGVAISPLQKPSEIFAALFVEDSPAARAKAMTRIRQGYSILDNQLAQAKTLMRSLNAADKTKMEQYLEAIRQSELDLKRQEDWSAIPKPKVDAKLPKDITEKAQFVGQAQQLYDMIYLALVSGSTRVVGAIMPNYNVVPKGISGVDGDHHVLTHHGLVEEKIHQLSLIEDEEMKIIAGFLRKLKETPDGDGSLLDHTTVAIGSESNDLSRHAAEEVPILLAGGPFKHGRFVQKEVYVQNLYLTMLQNLGIEQDSWGNSNGTLSELV